MFLEHELKPFFLNLDQMGESDFENLEVKVEKICCDLCDEKFFIPENLDLHVERKHLSASEDKSFKCLFCSKLYTTRGSFRCHLNKFHKSKGFRCRFPLCAAVFRTEVNLENHYQKVHFITSEKKPFECEVCKNWYASKDYLKYHMKSHAKKEEQGPEMFKCLICKELFSSVYYLNKHKKENHKPEGIKCQIQPCQLYFKTTDEMKEHFENKHNNNCKFCSSSFFSRTHYFSHLRKVHFDKKCNFTQCTFYTDSRKEMEKHVKEKHNKNNKITDCIYCGKSYKNRITMSNHVRYTHSEIAICCDNTKCSLFFKTLEDLEKHKKEAHQRVEKHRKSAKCLYCPKIYADRGPYAVHIKTAHPDAIRCKYRKCFTFFKSEEDRQKHNEEKHVENFCCAHCDYKTSNRFNIINHFQSRHLPKEVKCPNCPKLFVNKASLNRHFDYSHKSKKCPHCLETMTNLQRHLITTNCPKCSQPFPCSKLLFDHKLKCTKKLECRECGKTFKIERLLKQHINLRHKAGQQWKGLKCKFCSTFFESTKSLRKHHLIEHFDLMKYKCDLCEKAFLTRNSCHLHLVAVHRIGGFGCKFCGKRVLSKHFLSEHLSKHHFRQPGWQNVE